MSSTNMSLVSETARLDRLKAQSQAPRQAEAAPAAPGAFSALMQSMEGASGAQAPAQGSLAQEAARAARKASAQPPRVTGEGQSPTMSDALLTGSWSQGAAAEAASGRSAPMQAPKSASPAAQVGETEDQQASKDEASDDESTAGPAGPDPSSLVGAWWSPPAQAQAVHRTGSGRPADGQQGSGDIADEAGVAKSRGRPGAERAGERADRADLASPGRTTLEAFGLGALSGGEAPTAASAGEAVVASADGPAAAAPLTDGAALAALMQSTQNGAAQAGAPSLPALAAAPAAQTTLPVAVDDPEFGNAVALTVARWSGEGIQQATLDLHPAELGPIQIRIDIQGKDAHISFAAAHERTRALLDDAMPNLAAALQTDGLSLAASRITDAVKPPESLLSANTSGGQPGGGQDPDARPREQRLPDEQARSSGLSTTRTALSWRASDMAPLVSGLERGSGSRPGLDLYA